MFKIERERTFWWPVRVQLAVDDKHETREFRVKLRQRSLSFLSRRVEDCANFSKPEDQVAAFQDFIVDWEGLQDEAGQPLAFTPDGLRLLLEIPAAQFGLIEAIRTALVPSAAAERRRGN